MNNEQPTNHDTQPIGHKDAVDENYPHDANDPFGGVIDSSLYLEPVAITLNFFANAVHANARDKQFHAVHVSEDGFIEQTCNNIHDEVSELHEAWRNSKLHEPCDKADKLAALGLPVLTACEEELADIVIRALDSMKRLGIEDVERVLWAKHAFNTTRAPMHGGKRS